ncbi:MAG: 6,7-dimethyl-8-ribityllumazine synthase [Candidatus Cloacimonetes bacterium]|nr:6,7-dimethyl-8-ribityllumazine synthase [Candidatus Cloacimonadota bacterium]
MPKIEGILTGQGLKIAVLVARFNSFVTEALLNGAVDGLRRHGVDPKDITVIKLPGAYEMPFVLKQVAMSQRYDGAVCLGAVIRGDTPHFDFVASENAKGIQKIMLDHDFPSAWGVITTNTVEQAVDRAGVKSGNKGYEAAVTVIELIQLGKAVQEGRVTE